MSDDNITFPLRGEATVGKRKYRWDFSPRGPLFNRVDGEPLEIQPGKNHPVWPAFEAWLENTDYMKNKRKLP